MFSSNKLRQIVVIDRLGSMSAAAEALNVSQPTLTKAVADVEQALGFGLFIRTARGVTATPEGRTFLDRAGRIITDFDMLVEDAKSNRTESDLILRIGAAPAALEGLHNLTVAKLLRMRPEISITMAGLSFERGLRLIRNGDLDLLLAPAADLAREKEMLIVPAGKLSLHLFCRRDHPVLQLPQIDFDAVRAYKLVAPDLLGSYAKRLARLLVEGNLNPHRRMHVIQHFSIAAEVVASTDLIGIVSGVYAGTATFRRRFALLDLDLLEPLHLGVAHLAHRLPNPAARAFINIVADLDR